MYIVYTNVLLMDSNPVLRFSWTTGRDILFGRYNGHKNIIRTFNINIMYVIIKPDRINHNIIYEAVIRVR